MAKKQNTAQSITHTEIICLAISAIDEQIEGWHTKCADTPEGDSFFMAATQELQCKREALTTLYKIETGTDYTV